MKTKILTEKDSEILSSVTKEMMKPRLAASVRNSREAEAALAAKKRAAHAAKA